MLVPSRKRVRKRTFALVKRPSLSETTMNWAPRKRVRKSVPMCCVCERSSAASISSRMYIGAGLNCSSAMISESAISDRWPPLSSVRLCFHTLPSCTLISSPSIRSCPSGGCNLAKFPGSSSAKIPPKSLRNGILSSVFRGWGRQCACVPVDLLPRCLQGVALVPVQLLDGLLDFFLVLQYCAQHLFQARFALLDAEPMSMCYATPCGNPERVARTYRSCSSPLGSPFSSYPAAVPPDPEFCPSAEQYRAC